MQTCPECGGRNEDGELFCGACGSYLEWEETQAATSGTDDRAPAHPAESAIPPGGIRLSADGGGGDDGTGESAVASAESAESGIPPGEIRLSREGAGGGGGRDPGEGATASLEAARHGESLGAGALGGLGGRAARAARRAADQATGGALSTASGTVSQARTQARSVTRAPGRAAVDQAARAAGGGALAQEAAAAAREVTGAAGARSSAHRPADAAAAGPSSAAATRPAPTRPEPASPAPARPGRPEPRQPAARKPGAPVQRRPVPRTEVEEEPPPRPGELVCGACGAGNAPHRHFCRRCGADLADAPVQPQRSWWRRVLRPDPRPGPAAGARPRSRRRRRFPTRLVVTLVVLALLGAGAWYWRESITGAYDAVVDRVAGDDPLNPAEIRATSERADRPASHVRDGIRDRSWAPEGDGVGEWVLLVLPEPARLVTVLVTAGNGGEEEQRLLEARPREVRLTLTTPEGEEVQDVELTDTGEPQPISVGRSDVEQVRLTILSVYGEELGAPVALAEVELLGRG